MTTHSSKYVLMICTAARGGMRSVVEGFQADGLFDKWNVKLLTPHVEGSLGRRVFTALKTYLTFMALILSGKVGLVHCHSAMKGSFWRKSIFSMTARAVGIPVIFHLHGSEMKSFVERQSPFMRKTIRRILERQSVVLVLSQSWFDYVVSIAPGARVQVLPNYVRMPDLSTKASHTPEDPIELLFLGVIGPRKGVYDLIPAFGRAQQAVPALKLVIGGNGEVERAKALAEELGLQQSITFAGWVSGEEKIRRLRRAQIYVLPSYNEGLPVSLLEAMSWKVPVISTNVGGIPELVRNNVDGLLINPGDQDALTSAIVKLASNVDEGIAMGQSAYTRVDTCYSVAVVLPMLEAIYREFKN